MWLSYFCDTYIVAWGMSVNRRRKERIYRIEKSVIVYMRKLVRLDKHRTPAYGEWREDVL